MTYELRTSEKSGFPRYYVWESQASKPVGEIFEKDDAEKIVAAVNNDAEITEWRENYNRLNLAFMKANEDTKDAVEALRLTHEWLSFGTFKHNGNTYIHNVNADSAESLLHNLRLDALRKFKTK